MSDPFKDFPKAFEGSQDPDEPIADDLYAKAIQIIEDARRTNKQFIVVSARLMPDGKRGEYTEAMVMSDMLRANVLIEIWQHMFVRSKRAAMAVLAKIVGISIEANEAQEGTKH